MSQDGQACVEALMTTSRLRGAAEPYWDGGLPEMGDVAYGDCARLAPRSPTACGWRSWSRSRCASSPDRADSRPAARAAEGELRGWLALPGDEAFDPASLLFAVDAFPPATFDIEYSGWVPTLELTVYVRALPAPGPVRVLQRAQLIDAQRVDESCFIWDRTGRLVAQSSQLAGVRLG